MATLSWEQIQFVIKANPRKLIIEAGRSYTDRLMMQGLGIKYKDLIKECTEFQSKTVHKVQTDSAISNKDFWERLLSQENMIFAAKGGSQHFNMNDSDEAVMHEILDDVRFGLSLRTWIKNFSLNSYRWDPMSVTLMEIEPIKVAADGSINQPACYPTYKSIYTIYDYDFTGRKLEYVSFKLKKAEAVDFGIDPNNPKIKDLKEDGDTEFYRLIDDIKDIIVYKDGDIVTLVERPEISQANPLPVPWRRCPGFLNSDLIRFNNPKQFVSPLDTIIELADCFLYDRSVRDLQKKYHGFAKAIEPLLRCPTCSGNKFVGSEPCPTCTPPGAKEGTGYANRTKINDVARFPLEILENTGFDFKKIFGYITPDIESWEKQDRSLNDYEQLSEFTYWGTIRIKSPAGAKQMSGGPDKTATEVNSNEAPKEARLNSTADFLESTENMIADFIGQYWFSDTWKKSSISYSRDYIFKTADELMDIYNSMRTAGAPDFALDDAMEKVLRARYQSNPMMMYKFLKMLDVEPFPHLKITEAKGVITDFVDYNCKLYFGEWSNTKFDIEWLMKTAAVLTEELKVYVTAKNLVDPAIQAHEQAVTLAAVKAAPVPSDN